MYAIDMRRACITLLLACSGLSAHASFDLVMAVDRDTKSVHRFDGSSGISLGSFASGYLTNPQSITISGSTAHVLDVVGSAGRVRRFNYNTGEYLGSTSLNSFGFGPSGLSLLIGPSGEYIASAGSFSGVGGFDPVTGSRMYAYFTPSAGNQGAVIVGGFLYNVESSGAMGWGPLPSTSTTNFPSNTTLSGAGNPWQLATAGGLIYTMNQSTNAIRSYSQTGVATGLVASLTSMINCKGLAMGHNNVMYAAGLSNVSSTGRIARLDTRTGESLGFINASQMTSPVSLAVRMAPEPATMAMLGIGALSLLRKRRR